MRLADAGARRAPALPGSACWPHAFGLSPSVLAGYVWGPDRRFVTGVGPADLLGHLDAANAGNGRAVGMCGLDCGHGRIARFKQRLALRIAWNVYQPRVGSPATEMHLRLIKPHVEKQCFARESPGSSQVTRSL